MLSLQLKSGEYLTIGEDVAVQIFKEAGSSAFRVSVKAPKELRILRGSVREREGEGRPDGLHTRRPSSPSSRRQHAKSLDKYAQRQARQAEQTEAVTEMDRLLSTMAPSAETAALRAQLDRLTATLEENEVSPGRTAG